MKFVTCFVFLILLNPTVSEAHRGGLETREEVETWYSGIGSRDCKDLRSDLGNPTTLRLYNDYFDGLVSGFNYEYGRIEAHIRAVGIPRFIHSNNTLRSMVSSNGFDCRWIFGDAAQRSLHNLRTSDEQKYFGVGVSSCLEFISDINRPVALERYRQWTLGFISGMNEGSRVWSYSRPNYRIIIDKNNIIADRASVECRTRNPAERFYNLVLEVASPFNDPSR